MSISDTKNAPTSVVLHYENQQVSISNGESVLEALEREQFSIPYSCRAGICHSCMMQGQGEIPTDAQQGLSTSQIAQNYFLACCCHPKQDLHLALRPKNDLATGVVIEKTMLNNTVLRITLQVSFTWLAGQFIQVWKDTTQARAYSIASRCDQQKMIELHIKRHDHGLLSRWLHDDVCIGDAIHLSPATGDCFYTDDHHNKPIIMAATGTGLAPLYGILQEAIAQQHTAPIYLYAASGDPSGLYYMNELIALANTHASIHYTPVVKRHTENGILEQDLSQTIKERHSDLNGHKIFLCGAPAMVKDLQRQCFFQGASSRDISVDAFEIAHIT
jgi:NAD(P)H-flavin reductase/ferredoxin